MNSKQFYESITPALARYLYQELKIWPDHPRRRGHYRIMKVVDGPRVLLLSFQINPRYVPQIAKLSEQLSMAAGLDKDYLIRVARGNGGTLAVEIPKPKSLWRTVTISDLPRRRGPQIVVGVDTEKRPTLMDISDQMTPHWLFAGMTGSGKTNAQRRMIQGLIQQNDPADVRLLLIDVGKLGKGWRPFASVPHLLHPIVTRQDEAARVLAWAVAEMDRRATEDRSSPRVVIGIDEAQDVFDERPDLVKAADTIAAKGREWGIHLALATQTPTTATLGSANIKRNMARLVGKMTDGQGATIAAGVRDSGAEGLSMAGDMLKVDALGITRVAVALVTEDDLDALPHTDEVSRLNLSEYDDVDHVRESVDVSRADPIAPAQAALAFATGRGIVWLAKQLGIGKDKAKRVKEFAEAMRAELARLGYPDCPTIPPTELQLEIRE